MRHVFVGNLEFDTRQSDLVRLFRKYGKIERVELKSGYAFVYFEDLRDAEDAIRETNKKRFGYEQRKLSVEWAQGGRGKSRGERPNKTLHVSNLDPIHTKELDVLRKFEAYGKILSVYIKHDHAFVRFATQEDATEAYYCAQNIKILDRIVVVSYAWNKPRKRSPSSPVFDSYKSRSSPSYDRYRSRSPVQRPRA